MLIPATQRLLPGGEAVGIDIQAGMIERLKARAHRAGVTNLQAILGDAAQPHVPGASFDLVFLCTALGEIPDRAAALLQCHRALKPGGVLSITEIFGDPHYGVPLDRPPFGGGSGFPAPGHARQMVVLHGQLHQALTGR